MYVATVTLVHANGDHESRRLYADSDTVIRSLDQGDDRERAVILYSDDSIVMMPKDGRLEVEYVATK